jgi:hypothetical protein
MVHYFLIGSIIALIVFLQFKNYFNTRKEVGLFAHIFPDGNDGNYELCQENPDGVELSIETKHNNSILEDIISHLNKYLTNNKNLVSDYHLMKDIVDRNCDSLEEKIQTQIPVPLYLGLAGTMSGILIGVGFLVVSGGLADLLKTASSGKNVGADGVEALLGGVALAMISSIIGILLTTSGSDQTKKAKSIVEKNKGIFLSWIQSVLLPKMSNDVPGTLVRMAENLSNFNSNFSQNSKDLGITLSKVSETSKLQSDLMNAINRLKITDLATANIDVYEKLKNSTKEIGIFAEYLHNANEYLSTVQALNQKLDSYEQRTQVIENAGKFFLKNEKWLAENFDNANLEVKDALERFNKTAGSAISNIQESMNGQILSLNGVLLMQQENLKESLQITTDILLDSLTKTQVTFEKEVSDQQNALSEKFKEISELVEELKNLAPIKEGIRDFKDAANRQNGKIEELASEIRSLTKSIIDSDTKKHELIIPKWIKNLTFALFGLISLTCLFYIIPPLIEWIIKMFGRVS